MPLSFLTAYLCTEIGCAVTLIGIQPVRVDYGAPSSISHFEWRLIWEGRRPADRDERFRMYRLVDMSRVTAPRQTQPHRLPRQP